MNVFHEAKNQSVEGQIAVAEVVMNRVGDTRYPNTVCEVVYQETQENLGKPRNKKIYQNTKGYIIPQEIGANSVGTVMVKVMRYLNTTIMHGKLQHGLQTCYMVS